MKNLLLGVVLIASGLAIGAFAWIIAFNPIEERKVVEFDADVKDATDVKGFNNRFVEWKRVSFGGAGAGGQGSAVIEAYSAEQFVEEVQKEEKVYTVVEDVGYSGYKNPPVVVKTYVAGVENRNMLLVFEDRYEAPGSYRDGWRVDSSNHDHAVFTRESSNLDVSIFITVIALLIFVVGCVHISVFKNIRRSRRIDTDL